MGNEETNVRCLCKYLEKHTDCSRYKIKISRHSWMNQFYLFSFPDKTNRNHTKELTKVDRINSDEHYKSAFKLTEIINNYGLKGQKVCQILRFISHFFLKIYIEL